MSHPPYFFRRPLLILVVAYAAALCVYRSWTPRARIPAQNPAWFASGASVRLEGRLAGEPESRRDRLHVFLEADVLQISPEDAPVPVGGRVRAVIEDEDFAGGWGDRVELKGVLSLPPTAAVPGGFDARRFLAQRGAHSQLLVSMGDAKILRPCSVFSPFRWIRNCRRRFLAVFDRRLDPYSSALMSGLLLGKKPADFSGMEEDFRRSGTFHLLVASGSNVGFWVAVWLWAARWLFFLPRRWAWLLAIPCAFFYAALAGGDPPVARAAVMVSLGIAAYLMAREDRLVYAVAMSAGLLLVLSPQALFEAGFQMSYAATLGVVLGLPALEQASTRIFKPLPSRSRMTWSVRWLVRLFFTSFTAQLALSPLLIHYFHRLSWVGLLSNMFAVPWAALCVALGIMLVGFDLAFAWMGPVVAVPAALAEGAVTGLWGMAKFFASLPGAEGIVPWNEIQIGVWAIMVCLFFLALAGGSSLFVKKSSAGFFVGGVWLVGATLLIGITLTPKADQPLSVTWLNVGLGDSIVVISPDGRTTLIDAGSPDAGRYSVVPYLRKIGCRKLDRVILTHGDPPHAGGLGHLLREFSVEQFLCSSVAWKERSWAPVREQIERAGIPHRFLAAGDSWKDGPAEWTVLNPGPVETKDPDANCLVIELRQGGNGVLLTADLSPEQQGAIASTSRPLSVLQWPHHGRIRPDFDFISSGRPQWSVVSGDQPGGFVRSFRYGAPVWRTGQTGSLRWRNWGSGTRFFGLSQPAIPLFRLPS